MCRLEEYLRDWKTTTTMLPLGQDRRGRSPADRRDRSRSAIRARISSSAQAELCSPVFHGLGDAIVAPYAGLSLAHGSNPAKINISGSSHDSIDP